MHQPQVNVPEILLKNVMHKQIQAVITATEPGILHGSGEMAQKAKELGLKAVLHTEQGSAVTPGQKIITLTGNPLQIVQGEDCLLGLISKPSGIATMARKAVMLAGRVRVVSGGWKKIPLEMKDMARSALEAGGVGMRLIDEPFLYLDKNYLRIFGSVKALLEGAAALPDRAAVVQLRGDTGPIEAETVAAALLGAKAVMVDTGNLTDLRLCSEELKRQGLRDQVKLAFAGGVQIEQLPDLQQEDVDIVDIGRAILDAPLLDFRYDVQKELILWS